METGKFLPEKYPDLAGSKPVEKAVKKSISAGESGPKTKEERVERYLERLERLVMDLEGQQKKKQLSGKGGEELPRALSLLREMVMKQYVRPHKVKMAESAARVEERAAEDMGIENAVYGEEQLEQRGEIAVKDVESSLDQWINYLSEPSEPYPAWFRFYAFRNVLDLGEYDKDKREFPKRSAGTIKLFPDIDRGALAYMEDIIVAAKDPAALERLCHAQEQTGTPPEQMLTKEKAKAFSSLSFAKQYAEGMRQAGEITPELREETRGEWKTYPMGSDPTPLWASLQNKGTAWCTKGFATAETQLQSGDFHVYYTLDAQGSPTIPRLAIRMQGDSIGEIRGVADGQQNVEENLADIAEKKMKPLPGAEQYLKASHDTKMLKMLYQKTAKGEDFTKDDLVFLYELKTPINGFGYQKHPRIAKLRASRNTEEDMPIVFDCPKEQIARNVDQIDEFTMAYVGELAPGIFEKLPEHVEYIFTSFPEGRIRKDTLEVGGTSKEALKTKLTEAKVNFSSAQWMIDSRDFTLLKEQAEMKFVRLSVDALGFPGGATTTEIYARAKELGLDLCPPEVGPEYRLKYADQPTGEYVFMGMKPITGSSGHPHVFRLYRSSDGLWLDSYWALPGGGWRPGHRFVFSLSKAS